MGETSGQRAALRQWPMSSVLWITVLLIMASFQTWRGAVVDGVLFYLLSGVLIIDRATRGRIVVFRRPIVAPHWLTLSVTGLLAGVFIATPRHGLIGFLAIIAIGITVLLLAWAPIPAREPVPHRPLLRSMTVWSLLIVALLLLEAIVFVLSVTLPGGSDAFPTISVVLDPLVENHVSRTVLVALWLAGGLALLGVWRKR